MVIPSGLSPAMVYNLLSIQKLQGQIKENQTTLVTGLKVSSIADNPAAYLAAIDLKQRNSQLKSAIDNMLQGIQTIKTAEEGIDSIIDLLELAKANAMKAAESVDYIAISRYAQQYESITEQAEGIVNNAYYSGVNLLKGSDLNISLGNNSYIKINGINADIYTDLGVTASTDWIDFTDPQNPVPKTVEINNDIDKIDNALKTLREFSDIFASVYSTVTNREEFSEAIRNILAEGVKKLTLADIDEEAAKLISYVTRQELAMRTLNLATHASFSMLRLFNNI